MPTTFNGNNLNGFTTEVRIEPRVAELAVSKVFGLGGMSAIGDEPHGRETRVTHELTGFASVAALQTYFDVTLPALIIGQRGTLAVPGYETHGDLIGVAVDPNPTNEGTLPDTSQSPTTYHRTIRLVFQQLS